MLRTLTMNRNDEISIAWHEAAIRSRQGFSEPRVPVVSTPDLCHRCASINLPTILQQPVDNSKGHFVVTLESRDELRASPCSLCRLFGSVAPSGLKKPYTTPEHCQLRVFSAAEVQETDVGRSVYGISRLDVNLLGVLHAVDRNGGMSLLMEAGPQETGYLCPIQNDRSAPYFGVRILTDQVDVHFVKRCISHCRENHDRDEACNINKGRTRMSAEARDHMQQSTYESDPRDTSDSPFSSRFFRLIDCTKRAIVGAPAGSPYIALLMCGEVLRTSHPVSQTLCVNGH